MRRTRWRFNEYRVEAGIHVQRFVRRARTARWLRPGSDKAGPKGSDRIRGRRAEIALSETKQG